jgi:RNA polymerase sigma-70 factor (ECF subfamily)
LSSSSAFERLVLPLASARKSDETPVPHEARKSARALDDETAMRLVQAGDKEALGSLFDRYSGLVLNVATRILHNPTEAQDVVQEVFLYIHRKSHVFDPGKGTFSSWLVQITYSRAFTRREHLGAATQKDCLRIEELTDLADAKADFSRMIDALSARAIIEQALVELTDRQRETLRMYFFEGYSLTEISEKQSETFTNTRHHYYRGIEKLKELVIGSHSRTKNEGVA